MNEERKTPEMREQMTAIERLRHSASHVLATAILCHFEPFDFAQDRLRRGMERVGRAT
jgi:threonyl-tRNA synthetase